MNVTGPRGSVERGPWQALMAVMAAALVWGLFAGGRPAAAGPVVVELHQTPCTIVEAEKEPRKFVSRNSADCMRINRETAGSRAFKVLRLRPGRTVFRVTNVNVPYTLGFWVRGKGVSRFTLPSVSGGGLEPGTTRDYVIDLKPGRYLYSCPLNPTPDYPLVVE